MGRYGDAYEEQEERRERERIRRWKQPLPDLSGLSAGKAHSVLVDSDHPMSYQHRRGFEDAIKGVPPGQTKRSMRSVRTAYEWGYGQGRIIRGSAA